MVGGYRVSRKCVDEQRFGFAGRAEANQADFAEPENGAVTQNSGLERKMRYKATLNLAEHRLR